MISDSPDSAGSRTGSAVIGGFPQFSRGGVPTLSAYATKKYRSFVGAKMAIYKILLLIEALTALLNALRELAEVFHWGLTVILMGALSDFFQWSNFWLYYLF